MAFPVGPRRRVLEHREDAALARVVGCRRGPCAKNPGGDGEDAMLEVGAEMDHGIGAEGNGLGRQCRLHGASSVARRVRR